MTKLDETDEQIIAILTRDARTSNREVARMIGLSDTAVRKRLKRLSSAGIAKVTAVVHPLSSGYNLTALVRLRTSPADARAIADRAAALESTSFTALTVICPLQSGPKSMLFWTRKGMKNAIQKTHAGGDYRQAA